MKHDGKVLGVDIVLDTLFNKKYAWSFWVFWLTNFNNIIQIWRINVDLIQKITSNKILFRISLILAFVVLVLIGTNIGIKQAKNELLEFDTSTVNGLIARCAAGHRKTELKIFNSSKQYFLMLVRLIHGKV
jgi:hypothetical protein